MDRHIVVAFRIAKTGPTSGGDASFVECARLIYTRGEALGGRLVAWGADVLAIAWDVDSVEEAIELAARVEELSGLPEPLWARGIAEGDLELLASDGQRMHLAWGPPLIIATALARAARAGEALVDVGVGAMRAGLAVQGERAYTLEGRSVRGWRLNVARPWVHAPSEGPWSEHTDRIVVASPPAEELSSEELLPVMDDEPEEEGATSSTRPRVVALLDRVRAASSRDPAGAEALAELRRERVRADAGSAAAQCQSALALALALAFVGRPDEALLEALDALARARDLRDARAVDACLALLAKLYAGAGMGAAATLLREGASRT